MLSETFVVNEATALAQLGHDVTVHAHERGDAEDTSGLPVSYRTDETTAQRARAMLRLALRHPIGVARDVAARGRWRRDEHVPPLRVLAPRMLADPSRHVHVHFAKASALDALRGSRITGTPYSLTAHAYDIYAAPANLAEKLRAALLVTTGCEYTARDLRAVAPGARVEVIVMGVDPDRFARTSAPVERRVVLAIGRLVEKKGFGTLVAAAADPALRGVADEIRIVGEGPLRTTLETQIAELGVGDTVRLVGALSPDRIRAELEGAAVLAMPSVVAADGDRDSMPVVVKEAMAVEVPVVVSDEVGLPEIVRPEFGRLVPPGSAPALARALADVLSLDAGPRAAMGRAARAHVVDHANLLTETTRLSAALGSES